MKHAKRRALIIVSRATILLKKNEIKIPPKVSKVKASPIFLVLTPCLLRIVGKVTKLIPIAIAKSRTLRNKKLSSQLYSADSTLSQLVIISHGFNEDKTLHWLKPLERRLSAAGRVEALEVALALILLLLLVAALPVRLHGEVLVAGVIGLVLQLLSTSIAEAFGSEEEAAGRLAAGGGLASLLYLELLDASFSLDGTIGAFAITTNLPLILTGLGLGALFIRSLTLMLSREKALDSLVYLEHGAHYAIGALGLLMLSGILLKQWHMHLPEWLSGLIGVVLLLLALFDSLRHRRNVSIQ